MPGISGAPRTGETVEVIVRVSRTTGQVVREGIVRAEFWAPGRGSAGEPDYSLAANWDPALRGFVCHADTSGWTPGQWTVQGRVRADAGHGPATGLSEPFPLHLRS